MPAQIPLDAWDRAIATLVRDERLAQNAKWGRQRHPNGTGPSVLPLQELSGDPRDATDLAEAMKALLASHAARGRVTWLDILLEEVLEAAAEAEPSRLQRELVQVAAVAQQHAAALDRDRDVITQTGRKERSVTATHVRILGLLAVAQEPLTADRLVGKWEAAAGRDRLPFLSAASIRSRLVDLRSWGFAVDQPRAARSRSGRPAATWTLLDREAWRTPTAMPTAVLDDAWIVLRDLEHAYSTDLVIAPALAEVRRLMTAAERALEVRA